MEATRLYREGCTLFNQERAEQSLSRLRRGERSVIIAALSSSGHRPGLTLWGWHYCRQAGLTRPGQSSPCESSEPRLLPAGEMQKKGGLELQGLTWLEPSGGSDRTSSPSVSPLFRTPQVKLSKLRVLAQIRKDIPSTIKSSYPEKHSLVFL